jgi:ferredoxin-NADP reductase/ferredoxin
MSYAISLKTHDGQRFDFNCDAEQNVLAAIEAADYYPPSLCKEGGCGACLATREAGDYRLENYSVAALPAEAAERGEVLLCRTYPKSDLRLTVAYNADRIHIGHTKPRNAEIVAVEQIAARTVRLVLRVLPDENGCQTLEFEPGQYMELEIPGQGVKRAYSLANTCNWDGTLEFLIRLQPGGRFSAYLLDQAKPGKTLLVHGPSGAFGIQGQSLAPRCFVAGGTGVAPFLSILRRMAEWQEDHETLLLLGVNNEKELFNRDEWERLQQVLPQLRVELCVWRPESDWSGFRGTPADALQAYLAETTVLPDIYLCGPPPMVDAAIQTALQAGVDIDRIYSERFVASSA